MTYTTKTYTRITITTKEGKQTIDLPQDSTLEIIEDDFEVESKKDYEREYNEQNLF